ncbi:chitobiase/beta-hexosaminidase C-terminal domain-containing protein [Neolewinella persica]|uniref:chitobiase/beta-hexosaminidase C-terminal domain-containing protein n=1 Tax=Neolewinella persica TaxID=70998 RepID=UPI0003A99B77|nr:chitobiase/beta-hexosaminidase C-terminal domain-containing protein [Neolewinella persica]
MIELIGRFHPLLLHLPIGVLVYAFTHWSFEYFFSKRTDKTDFTFALSIGALSAIASAVSGWILASDGGYDESLLNWHKYLGIGSAVGAVLLLWAYRTGSDQKLFGGLFTAFILLLTLTGHYGGSLTHGEGFLTVPSAVKTVVLPENIEEAHLFNDLVKPIVDRKCVSCHNPQKLKGELLLHTLAGWQAGGENGAILLPGSLTESPLINRVFLPKEDELHMPPSGKLQLTNEERNFLAWWIENMRDYDHQVKDLKTTAEIDDYLEALQAAQHPQPERPAAQQLVNLEQYGIIASLQSLDDSWVTVRLRNAASFNPEHLKNLRKIAPTIKSIDVSNSSIADKDLEVFSRFEHVNTINLSNCHISSEGIARLKELPSLRSLNLYGTRVDSTVLQLLNKLEGLKKVYLWETPLANAGLEKWRADYPQFEIIGGVDFAQFGESRLVPPVIVAEQDLFTDSLLVELDTKASKATIKYTTDGIIPNENSPEYTEPFYLFATTEVKAILSMPGWKDSEPISSTFIKSRFSIDRLRASVEPHENYTAQGVVTLKDLRKGGSSFGDGRWLGYLGDDLTLTADLGQEEEISVVTLGTLADHNAYIHLPRSIKISVSKDGRRYVPFQDKQIPVADGPTDVRVHNHLLRSEPTLARYIRIDIKSQNVNPAWHPAPGEPCWLFVDEILVE